MKEIQLEYKTAQELLHILLDYNLKNKYIFRGISRSDELYPSIMRNEESEDKYELEIKLLQIFFKKASIFLGGNVSPFDFVSTAQHYGLPTRLIDWTRNPFIALFFSLSSNAYDDYQILMLDENELITLDNIYITFNFADIEALGSLTPLYYYKKFISSLQSNLLDSIVNGYCAYNFIYDHNFKKEYKSKLKIKFDEGKFVVIDPNNTNARINAQQGLFIIPNSLDRQEISEQYKNSKTSYIKINKKLKSDLLLLLDKMGYSSTKLFFDMQNICNSIKNSRS